MKGNPKSKKKKSKKGRGFLGGKEKTTRGGDGGGGGGGSWADNDKIRVFWVPWVGSWSIVLYTYMYQYSGEIDSRQFFKTRYDMTLL